MADRGAERRGADDYAVASDEIEAFERDGYVHLQGVLSDDEMAEIEHVYDTFMRREIAVDGKDFNDVTTGAFASDPNEYAVVNVMLPRTYYPEWQGNVFERRAASIARQLCGGGMVIDFDQLLAKHPGREDAVFGWHQDQAYWIGTDDRRTATCWLAVDDSTIQNGCLQFLPGSHLQPLRPHRPLHGERSASHTLVTDLRAGDVMRPAEIKRGDITVHSEGVLHGSGGNSTTGSWRRAYIVAFRGRLTVETERARGFTHSHNDQLEVLHQVDGLGGRSVDDLLAAARARFDRVVPNDLPDEQARGALVIDIRPSEQRDRDGELPGAIVIDRNVLEWRLDPSSAHHISGVVDHDQRIILVCNEGYSSSLAAATLQDLGLHRATDLIGGYQQWSTTRRR